MFTGCSIADELMDSFEQLLRVGARRNIQYDRIILENSGVAEPQNIRDQFNEAIAMGHPLMSKIHLDSLVTVVDSATFIRDYSSRAPLAARPELGDGGGLRPVVDLLVEQVECADYVILNKSDMIDDQTMESLKVIIGSLNPLATIDSCEHGKIDVNRIFGAETNPGIVARLNTEGHHRGSVAAAKACEEDLSHPHSQEDCNHQENACHHDSHDHDHSCGDCKSNQCHHHGHESGHQHSHESSQKKRETTTAASRFGIFSFVYTRRRPFHPQRLKELVLKWMPVSSNKALDGDEPAPANVDSPIRTVLRSKGFVWLSHAHTTALYWSHAGQHFELRDEGEWWAAVPDDEWPSVPAQRATIFADFNGEFGDRRQEIVFIGAFMDKEAICAQLDSALLNDEEMKEYIVQWQSDPDPEHQRGI